MSGEADTLTLRSRPFFARAAISLIVGINNALLLLTAPHVTSLTFWNARAVGSAALLVLISTALTFAFVIDLAKLTFWCDALVLLVGPFSFATAVYTTAS